MTTPKYYVFDTSTKIASMRVAVLAKKITVSTEAGPSHLNSRSSRRNITKGQSHRKCDIDTIFFIVTELVHVAYQKIATNK